MGQDDDERRAAPAARGEDDVEGRGRQRLGDHEHAIVGQVAERELDVGGLERRPWRGVRGPLARPSAPRTAPRRARHRGRPSRASDGSDRGGSRRGRSPAPRGRAGPPRPPGRRRSCRRARRRPRPPPRPPPTPTAGPAASCFDARNRRCGLPTTTITSASLPHGPPNQSAGRVARPAGRFEAGMSRQTCVCMAPRDRTGRSGGAA